MRQPLFLLGLCILVSVTLVGCGGDKNIKDAPYENVPLEDVEGNDLTGASAETLYQAGHAQLVAENPEKALRVYLEIKSRFPFSPQATQAALETATAHYLLEEYARTVSAADRFIKQHPRHPHIDYLYYLRGLANYHRNDGGLLDGNTDQRDLSYLHQAFSDFKLLLRNYPDSAYAKDAQMHMIEIRNRLADFELSVAEYYLKRRAYVAAARRASYIIKHYQRSAATPRALEIMQESYIQLGLPGLAGDARSILQASYPDYILHRDAFYRELARHRDAEDASLAASGAQVAAGDNAGFFESLWNEVRPGGEQGEEEKEWRGWLEGESAKSVGSGQPQQPSGDAAVTPAAAAPVTDENRDSAWMESGATKRVGSGAGSRADRGAEDNNPGLFKALWNLITPGDGDAETDKPSGDTESNAASAPDDGGGSSSPWLDGRPAKQM